MAAELEPEEKAATVTSRAIDEVDKGVKTINLTEDDGYHTRTKELSPEEKTKREAWEKLAS